LQRCFPAFLQLGGHEPIVGIGLLILPFSQAGLVAKAFELLLVGASHLFLFPVAGRERLRVDVELHRR